MSYIPCVPFTQILHRYLVLQFLRYTLCTVVMMDWSRHGILWPHPFNLSELSTPASRLVLGVGWSKQKPQSSELVSTFMPLAQLWSTPIQQFFAAWCHWEHTFATGHIAHLRPINTRVRNVVCVGQ